MGSDRLEVEAQTTHRNACSGCAGDLHELPSIHIHFAPPFAFRMIKKLSLSSGCQALIQQGL
jgi:hypothetical protein